jgi:hypothetical protein
LKRQYWLAHIWCWPTPLATMVSLGLEVAQHLEHLLGLEGVALGPRLVGQRVLLLPAREGGAPRRDVGLRGPRSRLLADLLDEVLDDEAGVADDRHVGAADLAELGRVDVGVDDLGLGGEVGDLAGDPVVEAGAEGDQQVGLLHRHDGRVVAVHARHAEAQLVIVGERAAGHEGGDHRHLEQLRQLLEGLGGTGLQDAAPGVEDRLLGGEHQLHRLLDLLRVAVVVGL